MSRRRRYQGVTAFIGLPGSGKTYALAEIGLDAMRRGREVWCNAGFDLEGARRFSSFEEFAEIPNDAVVVWDELPLYVNARKWQEFPDGLLYRLTQIRKDGLELYYSTIDWRMVDVNVRRLTFWTWECRGITTRLLIRRRFPPEERRKKDERAREIKLVRVRASVGQAYDTFGKVAVRSRALTAGESESWSLPGTTVEDPAGIRQAPIVDLTRRAPAEVIAPAPPVPLPPTT